ncbi:MAG: hypothetical protein Aurels2KO_01700 [Aureliella sp.]
MTASMSADDLLAQVMQRNDRIQTPVVDKVPEAAPLGLVRLEESMRESAQSVFSKMCGIELSLTQMHPGPAETRYDLSGIIGISGALKATVVINLSAELAFAVADAFTGERPTEIDEGLIDMVGELANMIGGNAKERLSNPDLSLGLPTVVTGTGHCIAFATDMKLCTMSFETEHGPLQIELGASEKKKR